MSDAEVLEQVTGIPFDEFERAYRLMTTAPELVPPLMAQLAERFRAHPDHDFVMGPNFLSVLALFSERGRRMAENAMTTTEIQSRQRQVAAQSPALAESFPELVRRE